MEQYISQLERLKSSVLSIVAVLYGLGLVNWAIYSYDNSLGLVSALDMQYFVAGLIPFLVFVLIYFTFKTKFGFISKIRIRLNKRSKGILRIIRILLIIFYLLGFLTGIVGIAIMLIWKENKMAESMAACGLFIYFICIAVLPYDAWPLIKRSTFSQKMKFVRLVRRMNYGMGQMVKYIAALYALLGLIVYAYWGYPNLPQELGGAKPKQCILECKKGILSDQTIKTIFQDTSKTILRSELIDIYFYGSDKILFKLHHSYTPTVFEMKRSDITLIEWQNSK